MTKREMLDSINSNCKYNQYNGIVVTDIGDDFATVEGELKPQALNPLGMAHGGFVYSLCDVAAGAIFAPRYKFFVTLSGSLYFMRPGKGDKLRCEASLIKRGRTVNVVQTDVFDSEGTNTARGTFEIYIREN